MHLTKNEDSVVQDDEATSDSDSVTKNEDSQMQGDHMDAVSNMDFVIKCEDSQAPNNEEAPSDSDSVTKNGDRQVQDDAKATSDSDSDDEVNVVIGNLKTTPTSYNILNIKKGGFLQTSGVVEKLKQPLGKFNIDEFENIGSINGIPADEYNLDTIEDKPWRQPGADITDYFNYGLNEESWRAYCERQRRMRSESGVGLVLNAGTGPGSAGGLPNSIGGRIPAVTITNYNSKYSGIIGPKRAGPPPGRRMAGTIEVIGSTGIASRRNAEKSPLKENIIQVLTADRREYSRKGPPPPPFVDMSIPTPMPPMGHANIPPTFDMPPPGYIEPASYFTPEPDSYYNSYEPTQDRQWHDNLKIGNFQNWQPANISIPLTGNDVKPQNTKTLSPIVAPNISSNFPKDRDRERDFNGSNRDHNREKDQDRDEVSMLRDREMEPSIRDVDIQRYDRERSRSMYKHKDRHRHRSTSRSRRHKSSRSRSPSGRKKKSRRSDRERSKEESD